MRTLIAGLALLLAACASGGLPYPRWAEVGRQWGCDPLEVQAEKMRLNAGLGAGFHFEPQIGWTACELMNHNGEPRHVEAITTGYGRSYNLIYQAPSGGRSHYVKLDADEAGVWRVSAVAW